MLANQRFTWPRFLLQAQPILFWLPGSNPDRPDTDPATDAPLPRITQTVISSPCHPICLLLDVSLAARGCKITSWLVTMSCSLTLRAFQPIRSVV